MSALFCTVQDGTGREISLPVVSVSHSSKRMHLILHQRVLFQRLNHQQTVVSIKDPLYYCLLQPL